MIPATIAALRFLSIDCWQTLTDVQIMEILKMDLQINAEQYDKYLDSLVALAKSAISREGIKIEDTVEDGMQIQFYFIRIFLLVCPILFSQKAGE